MKEGTSGSLSRRIVYGILTLFLVLGVLLAAAELIVHRQYVSLSDELDERIERLNLLQDTERAFLETVSYLRAYAAYEREDLYQQSVSSREEYDRLFHALEHAYAGAVQQGLSGVTELEGLNERFDRYSAQAMNLIGAGDIAALAELSESQGSALVRRMETEFAGLVDMQRERIGDLTAQIRTLGYIILLVTALALIAALGAALLLIRYLKRSFIQPIVAAEAAVGKIERGEIVELGGSSRGDEIGSLLGGIGRMAEGIRSRQYELENNLVRMEEQREELEAQNDELEAQNEQILEQRRKLERTLEQLTHREQQLEAINAYQQSLVGLTDLGDFLERAIGQLLLVTGRDAGMLVFRNEGSKDGGSSESGGPSAEEETRQTILERFGERGYEVLYSGGYPLSAEGFEGEPAGPALQAMRTNRPVSRRRPVSGAEKGAHGAYESAVDTYYPVYDGVGEERPAGFLLLTLYGDRSPEQGEEELADGLIRQFIGALFAQLTQAERQRQNREMNRLNRALEQEKRNLGDQRDATQQVIDSINEALIVCSPQGEILMCNRITGELLDPTFCTGRNFAEAMDEMNDKLGIVADAGDRIRTALASDLDGGRTRYSFEPPGQSARYFEVYIRRIEDVVWGDVRLFVFRDRTEEEETNRMRDEFVSVVSHELRTPLASILGFSELMLNRSVKPEKAQKYIGTIHGEAKRLSGLIGDFLDLQRIEAGKQNYRMLPLDLKPIAEDMAAQWDGRSGHAVRLSLPEGVCAVRSDGDRLKQIFHNLLSNAIKYSPGKEVVECAIRRGEDRWIVEIRDYGLGIPEEAKSKLFGKFYRVDNSDRRQIGGTGLGLAIVKEMIEDMGGAISFDSTLGEGSVFRFELPMLELANPAGAVLILEDDESLGRLILEAFREDGRPAVLFSEAEAALLALRQSPENRPPVLGIVDLSLAGELDGWDFIRLLAGEQGSLQIPIVISSALDPPQDYEEADLETYLRKPFTVKELLALGRRLIEDPPSRPALAIPAPSEPFARASLEQKGLDIRQVEVNSDFSIVEIGSEDKETPL
ncbi:ATP-binding protein [Saccharibacillus qingshengii]|uniref:ATP-binding protein n=1 Tax=Saccharibacillus qingshengii TaxID=1763540 RepID=UPI0015539740|nr:ATP-binding protein [Saccharibacillus qingshengii]